MAVAVRNWTNLDTGATTTTSATVNKPTGTQDGDLLLAFVSNYNGFGGDISVVPSGWTLLGTRTQWRQGGDFYARVYYKIASGEPASWTWQASVATEFIIDVVAISGVDTTTPINQSSQNTSASSTSTAAGTSVTPTVDNCLVLTHIFARSVATSTALTQPTGYTEDYDVRSTNAAVRLAEAYLLQTTATATGALSWGLGGTSAGTETSRVDIIAIAPAPGNVDATTATITFTPSIVEQPNIGDNASEPLALTPITTYEAPNADFGTEAFALTPVGADSQAIDDANSEYLTFTPLGVEAPQYPLIETGAEYLALSPAGSDLQAHQYTDLATAPLAFTITTHECYAQETPEFSVFVQKRWNMDNMHARWSTSVQNRWSVNLAVGGFDIPC